MRKGLLFILAGVFAAAILGFAVLGGHDDDAGISAKLEKHVATSPAARLGVGWRSTAEARLSAWGFAAGSDSLVAIRDALGSSTLPPRASVRPAALVDRFATGLPEPESGDAPFRPTIVLTPTPWNDGTLLLWIGLAGSNAAGIPRDLAEAPDHPAVTVEFDSKNVAAYRLVGDPSSLPIGDGNARSAAAIYELSVARDPATGPKTRYATLHIRYRIPGGADSTVHEIEQPITAADYFESIDDAPEMARFGAAVAGFGGLLRADPAVRDFSCDEAISLAQSAAEPDPDGARAELIKLMQRAQPLIDLPTAEPATLGEAHEERTSAPVH